jgi:hypothetical protein
MVEPGHGLERVAIHFVTDLILAEGELDAADNEAFDHRSRLRSGGDKAGRLEGWSKPGHNASIDQFRPKDNGAVLNGTEPTNGWFFQDVDLDVKTGAARKIMERLLPPTGWRHGRKGNPRSHATYLVKGEPLRTRKYSGPRGNIIELRGITRKKTHSLSVAPGSTHTSGEVIRFEEPLGNIGRGEDPTTLDRDVSDVAVAIVIAQDWPENNRHNLRLAYAKVLIENGVPQARAIAILEAVMEATGSDKSDVASTVQSTAETIKAGLPTARTSTVKEVLGDEIGTQVLQSIAKILRSTLVDFSDGIVMPERRAAQHHRSCH